jgi:hypothetical protein
MAEFRLGHRLSGALRQVYEYKTAVTEHYRTLLAESDVIRTTINPRVTRSGDRALAHRALRPYLAARPADAHLP